MRRNVLGTKIAKAAIVTASVIMMTTPAMAAGTNYGTTIGGTKTTTFDKYLVMDQEANVPNASFTYGITAGSAKSYDLEGKKFEIKQGVNADKVTMAGVGTSTAKTITYTVGDTTSTTANALIKGFDNTKEKVAIKTATLDFSACAFTEPGIYRYIVTESGTNQAITNDADLTRVVDVYVNDASDVDGKKLTIAGYVLHSNTNDSPDVTLGDTNGSSGAYTDTKLQGFTNDYDTSDITIRKEVTGNQASRDKYFEFSVVIDNAVPGTVYNVDISNADGTSGSNVATITDNTGKTNVTSLTVGENGKVSQKFYLQHGQEIKINGVAKTSTYSVLENAEDYKSTAAGVTDYTDNVAGTIESTDLKTSYLNTRDGIIPTGVMMTALPYAVVTLLGGFGAATIIMKKKKNTEIE